MNYRTTTTIRISERKRKGPQANRKPIRSSMTTTSSLLMAALLFTTSPLTTSTSKHWKNNHQSNDRTIRYWAAEAMSPSAELTAAAAAAVVRRNVISGAAIFTVGDAAAQLLTNSKRKVTTPLAIQSDTTTATPIAMQDESKAAATTTTTRTIPKTPNALVTAFSSLDMNRLYSSTVLGAIWSGFCVPFIYGTVEKTFPGKANIRQILIKVLVTCSILSTIGNYATMFARRFAAQYMTYQFDKNSSLRLKWFQKPIESTLLFLAIFKGCFKSCNRDIWEVIVDDLKIWPLYDLTCYSVIPPAWRPITTSIMSSAWAMYMSVISAKEEQDEEEEFFAAVAPTPPISAIEPPHVETKPETHQKIQVTPLDPFPNKAATRETTKRLIGVTGGQSLKINSLSLNNNNSSDADDENTEHKPGDQKM